MLFGSVPSPPRKPRSCTSTQVARQSTIPDHTAYLTSRGRPVRNRAPVAASASTTTRLTAKPYLVATDPKLASSDDRARGCGVADICRTIAASVPGFPCIVPCQKPRPGHAWSSAIPAKNTPVPASSRRPSRGLRQASSGRAISAPAAT